MNPHLHLNEVNGSKLIGERNISCVPAIGNRNTVASWLSLRGIKCIPSTSHKGFEPGMEIHRFKLVQITNDHPSRNTQTSAESNAQVDKVTADTDARMDCIKGGC